MTVKTGVKIYDCKAWGKNLYACKAWGKNLFLIAST